MRESGDTRGANILLGYKHVFSPDHFLDINASYNIWQGPNDNRSHENETWADGSEESIWQSQHQDVKISNWEAALDYSNPVLPWLRLEAGYKGNYNHENSPASYAGGTAENNLEPLNDLYNRFKYDTDISALYVNISGNHEQLTFSAGLRGEMWQIRTRSLGYGQTDADAAPFKKNDFALFPSASIGWSFLNGNELKLNYSRRVTAQGTLEPGWDVEAGLRKNIDAWSISLVCKDIFNSKETHNILYGNGYTQSINKWSGGRTLRLAVAYTFGKTRSHGHSRHNHIDTNGYGAEHNHD